MKKITAQEKAAIKKYYSNPSVKEIIMNECSGRYTMLVLRAHADSIILRNVNYQPITLTSDVYDEYLKRFLEIVPEISDNGSEKTKRFVIDFDLKGYSIEDKKNDKATREVLRAVILRVYDKLTSYPLFVFKEIRCSGRGFHMWFSCPELGFDSIREIIKVYLTEIEQEMVCSAIPVSWHNKRDFTGILMDISPDKTRGCVKALGSLSSKTLRPVSQISKEFIDKYFVNCDMSFCFPSILPRSFSDNELQTYILGSRLDFVCKANM